MDFSTVKYRHPLPSRRNLCIDRTQTWADTEEEEENVCDDDDDDDGDEDDGGDDEE